MVAGRIPHARRQGREPTPVRASQTTTPQAAATMTAHRSTTVQATTAVAGLILFAHILDPTLTRARVSQGIGVIPAPVAKVCQYSFNHQSGSLFPPAYSVCSAGTYETTAPTASNNRVCSTCPVGDFCTGPAAPQNCGSASLYANGGASACTPVSTGYYSTPESGSAATRTGQAICPTGSSCNGGVATVCSSTYFQNVTGQTSCLPCQSCASGLTLTHACITTADTVCADITPPVITLSGALTIYIECKQGIYTEPGYSAVDSYDGVITSKVQVSQSPTGNTLGTFPIVYTVSDAAGNQATPQTRTVIVHDTTPPIVSVTGPTTTSLEYFTTYIDQGATAVDLVNGNVTNRIVVTGIAQLAPNLQVANMVYTINYTASDLSGNFASAFRFVTVVLTRLPVITLNGPNIVILEASQLYATYVDQGATAWDVHDGNLTQYIVTSGVSAVDNTVLGNYIVTYSVKSLDGTRSAIPVNRTVTVIDNIPPVMMLNGNSSTTIQGATPYIDAGVSITDNFDSTSVLMSRLQVTGLNLVNTSRPAGTGFLISYAVSDTSGNKAHSLTRTVTVIDTIPPVITITGNNFVTVEAATSYTDAGATATDTLDGTDAVTSTNDVNLYPPSTPIDYSVVYNAQDNAGNQATPQTRTVHVIDTTPPVITVFGDLNVTVEAATFYADAGASATDTLDGSDAVTTYNPVNLKPSVTPALYIITYSSADKAGNQAINKTRNVTVVDTTPPVIVLYGNATIIQQGGYNFTDPFVQATDTLDGDITSSVVTTLFCLPPSIVQSLLPNGHPPTAVPTWSAIGTVNLAQYSVNSVNTFSPSESLYIIVYTISDASGNMAFVNRTVLIIDTLPPVIYLLVSPAMNLEGNTPSIPYANPLAINAVDVHDGNLTSAVSLVVVSSIGGATGGPGIVDTSAPIGTTYTFIYKVSDAAGNAATPVSRTITIIDNLPPVLTLEGRLFDIVHVGSFYEDPGYQSTDAYEGNLTSSVMVDGESIFEPALKTDLGDSFLITYTSIDENNNVAVAYRNVTVVAAIPPAASFANSQSAIAVYVIATVGILAILFIVLIVYRRRSQKITNAHASAYVLGAAGVASISFENPLFSGVDSWYHGKIDRQTAELRIRDAGAADGMFLVRNKGDSGKEFVISFSLFGRMFHYILEQQSTGEFKVQSTVMTGLGRNLHDIINRLQESRYEPLPTQLITPVPMPSIQDNPLYGVSPVNPSAGLYAETQCEDGLQNYSEPDLPSSIVSNPIYSIWTGPDGEKHAYRQIINDPTNLAKTTKIFTKQTDGGHDTYMEVTPESVDTGIPLYIQVAVAQPKGSELVSEANYGINPIRAAASQPAYDTIANSGALSNSSSSQPTYDIAGNTGTNSLDARTYDSVANTGSGAVTQPTYDIAGFHMGQETTDDDDQQQQPDSYVMIGHEPDDKPTNGTYGYLDIAQESTDDDIAFGFDSENTITVKHDEGAYGSTNDDDETDDSPSTDHISVVPSRSKATHDKIEGLCGTLTREQAEQRLVDAGYQVGMFLVRQKDSAGNSYAMSIILEKGPVHHLIEKSADGTFTIDKKQPSCNSVADAVQLLRTRSEAKTGCVTIPIA